MTPDNPAWWVQFASLPTVVIAILWAEWRIRPIALQVLAREKAQERLLAEVALKVGVDQGQIRALLSSSADG